MQSTDLHAQTASFSSPVRQQISRINPPMQEELDEMTMKQLRNAQSIRIPGQLLIHDPRDLMDLDCGIFCSGVRTHGIESIKQNGLLRIWKNWMRLSSIPLYNACLSFASIVFLCAALFGNTYAWTLRKQIQQEQRQTMLERSRADLLAGMNESLSEELTRTQTKSISWLQTSVTAAGISVKAEADVLDCFVNGAQEELVLQDQKGHLFLGKISCLNPAIHAGCRIRLEGQTGDVVDYIAASGKMYHLSEIQIHSMNHLQS